MDILEKTEKKVFFLAKFKQGRQSFRHDQPPVITHWASVAGKKELEGPLAHTFDVTSQDTYFGQTTWEQAEKHMQQLALETLAKKAGIQKTQFELVFSGDLLNQCIGSSFGMRDLKLNFAGLYGACSTMALSLALSATLVDSGAVKNVVAATSSHFCSAERQYRMPLE